MKTAYLLWHTHEIDDGNEDHKLIGVYASQADAENTIQQLKDKPGFCYQQNGLEISPYEIGKDHWLDGYSTMVSIYVKNLEPSDLENIFVSALQPIQTTYMKYALPPKTIH